MQCPRTERFLRQPQQLPDGPWSLRDAPPSRVHGRILVAGVAPDSAFGKGMPIAHPVKSPRCLRPAFPLGHVPARRESS